DHILSRLQVWRQVDSLIIPVIKITPRRSDRNDLPVDKKLVTIISRYENFERRGFGWKVKRFSKQAHLVISLRTRHIDPVGIPALLVDCTGLSNDLFPSQ